MSFYLFRFRALECAYGRWIPMSRRSSIATLAWTTTAAPMFRFFFGGRVTRINVSRKCSHSNSSIFCHSATRSTCSAVALSVITRHSTVNKCQVYGKEFANDLPSTNALGFWIVFHYDHPLLSWGHCNWQRSPNADGSLREQMSNGNIDHVVSSCFIVATVTGILSVCLGNRFLASLLSFFHLLESLHYGFHFPLFARLKRNKLTISN